MKVSLGPWARLSLRQQIVGLAVLSATIATLSVATIVWVNEAGARQSVAGQVNQITDERVARDAAHAYSICQMAQDFLQRSVDADLNTIHGALAKAGGVHIDEHHPIGWKAVNQTTKETVSVSLPQVQIDGHTFVDERSFDTKLPIIDDHTKETGDTYTLFERMNDAGDMLRVGTSVAGSDGKRAIGTYIPAFAPDGTPNAVIGKVLSGETYRGRAFVVNAWYITAYEPIRNPAGRVVGMLYAGVKQEAVSSLRKALRENTAGARSSVAIYYATGADKGKVVLAPEGEDAASAPQWAPAMIEKAVALQPGQLGKMSVPGPEGSHLLVSYAYFKPWDWAIAVVADSRDFAGAEQQVDSQFHRLLLQALLGGLIALTLAAFVAWLMSRTITRPLADLSIDLTSSATQIASSAKLEEANVVTFMTSSTEIAAAVNQISTTSRELVKTMVEIAEASDQTSALARTGKGGLHDMGTSMRELTSATSSISEKLGTIRAKAKNINTVVVAITKVADQTNLLSLNAAIEAERAGDAGAGFGVVAREIRRLADQSAASTLDIQQIVEEMQDAVTTGVDEMRDLTKAVERGITAAVAIGEQFSDIIQRVESSAPRYKTVQLAMENQSEGAQQIGEAMWQLTETARQTKDSAKDLNDVGRQLHSAVNVLKEHIFREAE